MHPGLNQNCNLSILSDQKTYNRIDFALKKSKKLDQTENMDRASIEFDYAKDLNHYWNPEQFSLLWGTWLWENSSPSQRVFLNQLYWIAYYSQIISAEIATIYFNQASAAALYGLEDFRIVCDTLDLESAQERAHVNAFKKISETFEFEKFKQRLFTYPMRGPFVKTMLFSDLSSIQQTIRKWQLRFYSGLSSNSPFIGCHYFTVRGLRTLNGKIVQHQLSKHGNSFSDLEMAPIPSKISVYHFIDESFHFNTSSVVSHDVVNSIAPPSKFEEMVVNMTLWGCQRDHFNFSTAINGIFWYDPALYTTVYKILRSKDFSMSHQDALNAIEKSFCQESEGAHASAETHAQAVENYIAYLADMRFVSKKNKEMQLMKKNNFQAHLEKNQKEFKKFQIENVYLAEEYKQEQEKLKHEASVTQKSIIDRSTNLQEIKPKVNQNQIETEQI